MLVICRIHILYVGPWPQQILGAQGILFLVLCSRQFYFQSTFINTFIRSCQQRQAGTHLPVEKRRLVEARSQCWEW